MKTYSLSIIQEIGEGCVNNDYKTICKTSKLLENLAKGDKLDCKDTVKDYYISYIYKKFMRAYTRYIISNPNCIKSISEDCGFNATNNGKSIGINEL